MNDYLVFGGVSSADYGTLIFPKEIDGAPKRDLEKIKIPGRSGSLIIDNGRYEDVRITYSGIIYDHEKFDEFITRMRSFILSGSGYRRLEDTFHEDEYRMAYFDGDFKPSVVRLWHKMGKFELPFICKPQRFLKIGEAEKMVFDPPLDLYNPTGFPAQPLIKLRGYGQLNVGRYSLSIAESAHPDLAIDCERMDIYSYNSYYDTYTNCNNLVSLESDFPVLEEGLNHITFDETISFLYITPKWWKL